MTSRTKLSTWAQRYLRRKGLIAQPHRDGENHLFENLLDLIDHVTALFVPIGGGQRAGALAHRPEIIFPLGLGAFRQGIPDQDIDDAHQGDGDSALTLCLRHRRASGLGHDYLSRFQRKIDAIYPIEAITQ